MHRKVVFKLQQDEDGFPPVNYESVWALPVKDDTLLIDNIPFFAREATLGDLVQVTQLNGELRYVSTLKKSGNSLIRIVYYPGTNPEEIRQALQLLGCSSELDEGHTLIAVNVPSESNLPAVQNFLRSGYEQDRWGYEEPILRQ